MLDECLVRWSACCPGRADTVMVSVLVDSGPSPSPHPWTDVINIMTCNI
ncbi:hypothetical protein ACGFIX_19385 [Nocardia salmonicida]